MKNYLVVQHTYSEFLGRVAAAAGWAAKAEPVHTARFVTARKTLAGQGGLLAEDMDGRRLLTMYNGDVLLPKGLDPMLEDEDGHWLAVRPEPLTYGLLFRPEMKHGMLEDIIMEAGNNLPPHIGESLGEARMEWEQMQETTALVLRGLVTALELMQEQRKMPVFNLKVESQ